MGCTHKALSDKQFGQGFFVHVRQPSRISQDFTNLRRGTFVQIYERLGEDTGGIVQHWTKQMVDSRCPFGKLPGKVGHQIPVLGIGGCRQPRFQIVCLVL